MYKSIVFNEKSLKRSQLIAFLFCAPVGTECQTVMGMAMDVLDPWTKQLPRNLSVAQTFYFGQRHPFALSFSYSPTEFFWLK